MTTRRGFLTAAATAIASPALVSPALAQPAVGGTARAQTLRFVPQSALASLDPIWTSASVSTNHGYYVWDTLYAVDSQFRPRPQMAEGHEVSADNRVWRIRLREGLRFHDGTPVRSADCAASLQRWAQVDPMGQLVARVLDRYDTSDDRVLVVHLQRPFPLLVAALAKPDAVTPFIMPERLAATPPSKAITEMVGSGPFRFIADEFNPGSRSVYERFDGYVPRQDAPDWASGGKVANFRRVEWQVIPDAGTAAAALQAGEVDWWERPSADLLPLLSKDRGIRVQKQNQAGSPACARLNCLQPPFNDVRVRQAVMMSVVQADYMTAVAGDDPANWTTCYSQYPKGTPYYSEVGGARLKGPHDSAAVNRALKDAGYAGEKVVILQPTDFPLISPLSDVMNDALKRAGMNTELSASDWGTVVQRRTNRGPIDKGGWSIFTTYGTAAGCKDPAVSPFVRGTGPKGWFGWWEDADTEAMVSSWVDAPDEDTRVKLAHAIDARCMDQVATVILGQIYVYTAFRADLSGVLEANNPLPWNIRRG